MAPKPLPAPTTRCETSSHTTWLSYGMKADLATLDWKVEVTHKLLGVLCYARTHYALYLITAPLLLLICSIDCFINCNSEFRPVACTFLPSLHWLRRSPTTANSRFVLLRFPAPLTSPLTDTTDPARLHCSSFVRSIDCFVTYNCEVWLH